MVMTLAIPLRKFYGLEDFITMRHIHNMTKVMLVTGMIVAYGYANEAFFAWYSGNPYEGYMMLNRMTGPYAVFYWSLIAINAVMIQLFWFRKRPRQHRAAVRAVAARERRHVARALRHHRHQPAPRLPALVVGHVLRRRGGTSRCSPGTIGLFLALFFLFVRFLPAIAIFEMRTIVPEAKLKRSTTGEVMAHDGTHRRRSTA